ncbi:hypothetical protein CRE_21810 [Caenorhabditis remanei]|uniref:Uncharacterized protein n=1 Tax=Caenorhabditis remanei TaxID=31234 RepID=E3MEL2_CAERE|nr:hypothetical protein CRE_21810 [Caenorhabditis remanei]
MKHLVVLGVFSILCAQIIDSAHVSEQDKKAAIKFYNRARNNFAKELPVANMNEIVYDDSLENKYPICEHALQLERQDSRVQVFHRLDFTGPDSSGIYTHEDAKKLAKETGEKKVRDEIWFLNPSHTRLACHLFEKPCPKQESLKGLCIFGGSENVPPMSKLIKGEPGSKCPNGKSAKWENLCKTSVSSTISYLGSVLFFVIFMSFY